MNSHAVADCPDERSTPRASNAPLAHAMRRAHVISGLPHTLCLLRCVEQGLSLEAPFKVLLLVTIEPKTLNALAGSLLGEHEQPF